MTSLKAIAFGAVLLTASCYAMAAPVGSVPSSAGSASAIHSAESEDAAIQPYRVHIPQTALDDLRRRVRATHWPDKEAVDDASQGVGTRPQTIGYPLADSPAGLAAWMIDHDEISYAAISKAFDGHPVGGLTRDAILDNITLYWLTNTATSSARLYWENKGRSPLVAAVQKTSEISLPVAISVFPGEIYRAPETWARRAYPNLIYFNEVDGGGHFAAWEEPELFAAELRAAFKSLRK